MIARAKSLNFNLTDALWKVKKLLIGLVVINLGILFGYLYSSSSEMAELMISLIVGLILLLLIVNKPLNGLLLLFLFMPFVEQYIEIPMGEGLPDLSFSRFIIAILMVFMLAQAAIGKFRFASPLSLAEVCQFAAIIGIISTAFLENNPNKFIRETLTGEFTPLIMYFFARNLVQDKESLNKFLWVVAIFGFAAAVYAMYEYTTGHILFVTKGLDTGQLRTSFSGNDLYLIRGLLGRAGNFGRVFISTIPISFYLFFNSKSAGQKILLTGMLAIQFYALFLTFNRTSWYALMIGLFILQFVYPQFRKLYFVLVFVAVIVLWTFWDQVSDSEVEKRVNHKTENFNGRSERWEAARNMWRAKPIRGWGFTGYPTQSGRFRTDGLRENFATPENNYLSLMVSTGLIGFLPYMASLLVPFFDSLRLFFRARAPDWSGFIKSETIAIYWCVIICFAIGSYTQLQNQPMVSMIPFAMAGAIVGTHQYKLRKVKTKKALSSHNRQITSSQQWAGQPVAHLRS